MNWLGWRAFAAESIQQVSLCQLGGGLQKELNIFSGHCSRVIYVPWISLGLLNLVNW